MLGQDQAVFKNITCSGCHSFIKGMIAVDFHVDIAVFGHSSTSPGCRQRASMDTTPAKPSKGVRASNGGMDHSFTTAHPTLNRNLLFVATRPEDNTAVREYRVLPLFAFHTRATNT